MPAQTLAPTLNVLGSVPNVHHAPVTNPTPPNIVPVVPFVPEAEPTPAAP